MVSYLNPVVSNLASHQVACPSTRSFFISSRTPRFFLFVFFTRPPSSLSLTRLFHSAWNPSYFCEIPGKNGPHTIEMMNRSTVAGVNLRRRHRSSQTHPTHHLDTVTTIPFCVEILQGLHWTLLVALKILRQPALNVQSVIATSCLDCRHSCHIPRPVWSTIQKSRLPPVRCPRKSSRILWHTMNLYHCTGCHSR